MTKEEIDELQKDHQAEMMHYGPLIPTEVFDLAREGLAQREYEGEPLTGQHHIDDFTVMNPFASSPKG